MVDIGKGTTDIAVLSMGGLARCESLPVGSGAFDEEIIRFVRREHNIAIGVLTAERIKKTIGCVKPRSLEIGMTVSGLNMFNGLPQSVEVNTTQLYEVMMIAANEIIGSIQRVFEQTAPEMVADTSGLTPFNLNHNVFPKDLGAYLAYGEEWQKTCPAPRLAYEYHFWWHQYCDVGGIQFARRIYEDNKAYRKAGYQGIIQDGSQRSFWPNGFAFWVYGETLFDADRSFEELVEDYFSHAYGEYWQEIVAYLTEIGNRFDVNYLEVEHRSRKDFTSPEHAEMLRTIPAFVSEMEPKLKEWTYSRYRVQTVSMRLLRYHAWYCKALAEAFAIRADGDIAGGKEAYVNFYREFGRYEAEIERYFDQYLAFSAFNREMFRMPENKPVATEML